MMHLVDSARGALKLYALHLRHPGTVSADQAQAAGQDALTRLDLLHSSDLALAEAYAAARAAVPAPYTVAVAPGNAQGKNLMVMVLDGPHLIQTVFGNSPQGIVELLRIKGGRMSTLEQLKRRYTLPYLTLEQVRTEHLPHIKTDRHLLRLIKDGEVALHPSRLHDSNRAPRVIYLPDLARWLDTRVQAQALMAA